jgi:hypothetical protein
MAYKPWLRQRAAALLSAESYAWLAIKLQPVLVCLALGVPTD